MIYCLLVGYLCSLQTNKLPEGFVYIKAIIPDIVVELRYHGSNNFVGQPIEGYNDSRCILTRSAADKLKNVQNELRHVGLGLKIFDDYRPQKAVDHFVRWSKNSNTKMKTKYYPEVAKENLFKEGYISTRSGHSRGSTVDLSIISLQNMKELDMGTQYDFFGKESWLSNINISALQRSNRMLLQSLMKKHGFNPLKEEWWHFTMVDEPFPDTYFNFPIQ